MNHARELTRLAHPVPDSMPPGSLFLGLPIGGSQAAATYSARGPAGPTPWEQALRQVSKRGRPSHKLSEAYNLALAARIHRGGFAAPEIPQAAHMGRVLPQGISIPIYPPATFYHEISIPRVLRRNCVDAGRFWQSPATNMRMMPLDRCIAA
jgi:hypothetical protein